MRRLTLKSIERRIEALKQKAEKLKKNDKPPALRAIAKMMKKHGISIGDLRGTVLGKAGRARASKLKGRKVKAMYRHPKTGETWSGRGRPARWLAAAEKAGRKRNEFLVK